MKILPIDKFENDLQRGDVILTDETEFMVCDGGCFYKENPHLLCIKGSDVGKYYELQDEAISQNAGFMVSKEWVFRNFHSVSDMKILLGSYNFYQNKTNGAFGASKIRDRFFHNFKRDRTIKLELKNEMSVMLLDFNENLKNGDIIECRKSCWPYEKNVKFMVVRVFDDVGDVVRLVVTSGYKAGLALICGVFKVSNLKNDYIVNADELVKNWKYIFKESCDIKQTYVNLQNRNIFANEVKFFSRNYLKKIRSKFLGHL